MISCSKCFAQIADGSNFCSECGHEIVEQTERPYDIYCSKCGQKLVRGKHIGAPQPGGFGAAAVQASVPENVASVLCYLFWWVTGMVFLFSDKRRIVRFHAAQSVVVFGALTVLEFVTLRLARNWFMDQQWYSVLGFLAASIIGFTWIAIWVMLMLHAYEKKPMRVPLAASIADKIAGG